MIIWIYYLASGKWKPREQQAWRMVNTMQTSSSLLHGNRKHFVLLDVQYSHVSRAVCHNGPL